jgi:peptidoglycan/LPS O-acetylase OafA/YrhL
MDGPQATLPFLKSGDSFRADIEALRGVAVLLLVGCHCGISWCMGRFVGVDIFFVISGYSITGLLVREYRETSRIDLTGFFARRALAGEAATRLSRVLDGAPALAHRSGD